MKGQKLSVAIAQLLQLKAAKGLSNKEIAEICGVTPSAVTELFTGRTKNVPFPWVEKLIAAYDLDANYFFRKGLAMQQYLEPANGEFKNIPLLGRIAAGFNRQSDEIHEGGFMVPTFMLPKKRPYFALQVSGDSMIGAGILDGDICIIEKQENPASLKHGDIAAFRIDGDATLKYFHKKDKEAWLVPANPNYQAIPLNATRDVELIGPFVSLLRPPS